MNNFYVGHGDDAFGPFSRANIGEGLRHSCSFQVLLIILMNAYVVLISMWMNFQVVCMLCSI